ncbi:uncharacterized protein LOC120217699 [Hibiscus syriacus]|uniref:uncharacterized protein LOC120217699 n=1 Tax=Hibiscus syriacus TaxID=106335 RepID=UPI00192290BB|nr:uncharacterized protein LOC120217699 [Hibiscus syriacus]
MAEERGLIVDVEGFNNAMDEAREKSRSARNKKLLSWMLMLPLHCTRRGCLQQMIPSNSFGSRSACIFRWHFSRCLLVWVIILVRENIEGSMSRWLLREISVSAAS